MKNDIAKNIYDHMIVNDDIVLLTGDLGYRLFDNIAADFPNKFYNCGISEQNMVLVAAGLALSGKIPIIYSIGNFISLRVLEQIRNSICYHNLNVNIISNGVGFSYGQLGFTHHLTEDLGALRALPNIDIYSPANINEAQYYFNRMIANSRPSYFRLDKTSANNNFNINDVSGLNYIKEGKSVLICSVGGVLEEVLKANDMLIEKNVNVGVISFVKMKPDSLSVIKEIFNKYKYIITVEESNLSAGFGSFVLELLNELDIQIKAYRIGLKNIYSSIIGDQKYLRNYYGINSKSIFDLVISIQKGAIDEK